MSIIFQRQIFILSYIQEQNRRNVFPNKTKIIEKILEKFDTEISENTLDRDLHFIRNEIGVDLKSVRGKGYQIENLSELDNTFINDFSRSMAMILSQNSRAVLPEPVIYETRNFAGTDFFQDILKACENNLECVMTYYNYENLSEKEYEIQPYKLKLKDYRWYILAKDKNAPEIDFKIFGLERIRDFNVTKNKYKPENIDFEIPFENAFGMFTKYQDENRNYSLSEPIKIVLEFDLRDGNYIKSNPIHHSQKILKETEKNIQFELFIMPTLDLIKELLSRSWSIKIIEPEALRKQFLDYWKSAVKRNS
ncbi:MAG: WYL domain-containing protein [Weeksellaceae bacterium]|nr:WYL domain-containing protein [Bacteroidota bacterium]MCG2780375.1 WYL domain-containing protein [Weeksellaceae bacterium]